MKMSILKFWPTYSPVLRIENILGLGNLVQQSGTFVYLRSPKVLPIDFSFKKPVEPNF